MSQTYFAILTAIGEAKLANATALGTTLQLTQMGIGDGNGSTHCPTAARPPWFEKTAAHR
jgi:phage-related tail fiber protein